MQTPNTYGILMEYAPGLPLYDLGPATRLQALTALQEVVVTWLHARNLVHGDLREPNVFYEHPNIITLLDLDWVGTRGHAQYDRVLNPRLPWHVDAGCYQLIMPAHDIWRIEEMWRAAEAEGNAQALAVAAVN